MNDLVISKNVLEELKISPTELLVDIAIYLYDKERLSMGQAKKLAQLTQIEFQKEMKKREVFIKYDIQDLETDLSNLSVNE
ncbi:UPF0175 family protein [Saprospiraceae bacterium]|nr:UPF0175 family protein [Saprospiraceae bacterium]